MFKKLGNVFSMLKNAQQMQSQMSELQDSLAHVRVEGSTGGGMVKVQATGQQKIVTATIDDSLLESPDKEMLEDLLVGAANQALEKSREAAAEEMAKLTEGLDLPGLEEALQQIDPNPPGGTTTEN